MLVRVDRPIVAVRDLEAARADYQRLLGRRPERCEAHPSLGSASAVFRVANAALELLAPVGPGSVGEMLRARLDAAGEGLVGLAFGTDDADACAAALRARGLRAGEPEPGLGHDDTGRERRFRSVGLPPEATGGPRLFVIEREPPGEAAPPDAPAPGLVSDLAADLLAAPSAAVEALDHIVVESLDLDAARTLYGDGLGLRLALDRRFEARGLRILFFRVGGVTVEVGGRLDPPQAAAGRSRDRFGGLAWRTRDVDAARQRLAAAGVNVSELRAGFKPGTRVCTVRDATCGVPTLLIGPG